MKFGLFLTSYMYAMYLPEALGSLKAQTRKPDILIFIDDASIDESVKIAKASGICWDEIMVNEKNIGVSRSTNRAVAALIEKGCECICGLSADDKFNPRYIELTRAALEVAPKEVAFIYTHVKRFNENSESPDKKPEWNYSRLLGGNYVHGSSLIRSSVWQEVGGLPEVDYEEDWAMFKNMAKLGYCGQLLPEYLLYWRRHNLSRSDHGTAKRLLKFKEAGKW